MNKLLNMAIYFNKIEEKENAYGVFSYDKKIEKILSDFYELPHAILISFIVDDETDSGMAEETPLLIKNALGNLKINELLKLEINDLINLFVKNKITNNPEKNAKLIFEMLKIIELEYNSQAINIWNDNPSSQELKRRLLQFKGMNARKANLLALVLVNKFKVKLSEYASINISNDKNVRRAMLEMKLIDEFSSYDDMKKICTILNPNYPGIFDSFFWSIGEYFFNSKPDFKFKMIDEDFIGSCLMISLKYV
ncbi:MAG: hypothetical protein ACRC8C_00155 [Mycoplasmoidaceae bacterium]